MLQSLNFQRDIVRLYEKYVGLLLTPTKISALYRYPLCETSLRPNQWYTEKPLGVNAVKKIVSDMAKQAGLSGHFTNHSLRVTAAMRMFNSGVDEQVIKSITGHKSDAVHTYKNVGAHLLENAQRSIVSGGDSDKKNFKFVNRKVKVPPAESLCAKAHQKTCQFADEKGVCPPNCAVLKKIDAAMEKKSVKRLKLSVKYRRN